MWEKLAFRFEIKSFESRAPCLSTVGKFPKGLLKCYIICENVPFLVPWEHFVMCEVYVL